MAQFRAYQFLYGAKEIKRNNVAMSEQAQAQKVAESDKQRIDHIWVELEVHVRRD